MSTDLIPAEELEELCRKAAMYDFLKSKALKDTGHELGNGAHWTIGFYSRDRRLSFEETLLEEIRK